MRDRNLTKVLVIGNSHAACLKRACAQTSLNLSISFAVMSGGTGPYFYIDEGQKLAVLREFGKEAYYTPEATAFLPLDSYDAIVFSALGRVFGGIGASEPVIEGCQVKEFGLKVFETGTLVSKACFKDCLIDWLDDLPIARLVKQSREVFHRKIYIQPYPYFSEDVVQHPDFILNKMYQEPAEMYNFIQHIKDEWLSDLCRQVDARLLPYPESATTGQFIKSELVRSADLIHPIDEFGVATLQELEALSS